jgi:hypothetical protein
VFGRTGNVVAAEGDYTLTQLAGVTITSPVSGQALVYNGTSWVNNTETYVGTVTSVAASVPTGLTIAGSPITTSGTLAFGLDTGYVIPLQATLDAKALKATTISTTAPLTGGGDLSANRTFAIAKSTISVDGYLAATDFTIFNNKQAALSGSGIVKSTAGVISYLTDNTANWDTAYTNRITSLTTTGSSGAATLSGNVLNIPNYSSALTGYVPYTGATQDVDLGAFKLNAQSLHAKGTGGLGHLGLKYQSASATASANEVSLFADSLGDLSWLNGNLYLSKFIISGNTAARSYTFPNANGTVALTSDISYPVTSVFGRTGAVVATSGDYTTTQVTEGTNLYFTDTRARAAISLTTTGTSGAATYVSGVINIPQYQGVLTNPVTGTGTTNTLPKFTGASAIGNSNITDSGTLITLGSNSFVNGSLFVGANNPNGWTAGLVTSSPFTGGTSVFGNVVDGTIQSGVTANATYFRSQSATAAAAFTLTNIQHYWAVQGTFGAGSSVVTQRGFWAGASLIGATNNYAFQGSIPSGTNRWNLYMDGTADNYMAGSLGIGTTSLTGYSLAVGKILQGRLQVLQFIKMVQFKVM